MRPGGVTGWPNGTVIYVNTITNHNGNGTPTIDEVNAITAAITSWDWGVTTTANQALATATVNVELGDPTNQDDWAGCAQAASACSGPEWNTPSGSIFAGSIAITSESRLHFTGFSWVSARR